MTQAAKTAAPVTFLLSTAQYAEFFVLEKSVSSAEVRLGLDIRNAAGRERLTWKWLLKMYSARTRMAAIMRAASTLRAS